MGERELALLLRDACGLDRLRPSGEQEEQLERLAEEKDGADREKESAETAKQREREEAVAFAGTADYRNDETVDRVRGDHDKTDHADPALNKPKQEVFIVDGAVGTDNRKSFAPSPGATSLRDGDVEVDEVCAVLRGLLLAAGKDWCWCRPCL